MDTYDGKIWENCGNLCKNRRQTVENLWERWKMYGEIMETQWKTCGTFFKNCGRIWQNKGTYGKERNTEKNWKTV